MLFDFTEEQKMFRREVRRFTEKELAPGAKERGKSYSYPRELIKLMAAAGLTSVAIPEEHGGQGGDWVAAGIAVEELAREDTTAILFTIFPSMAYDFFRNSPFSQRMMAEWLPSLINGEKWCCFTVTEADAGSDVANIKTKATREGEFYVINGEKTCISVSSNDEAVGMLLAKTLNGMTWFWVPFDSPGVTKNPIQHAGLKSWAPATLFLDGVRIPKEYCLVEEGQGHGTFLKATCLARACLGLMALGPAQACLEQAMAYAQERKTFGRPLASYQGISLKIAEHATLIEAARLLCYRTLALTDAGQLPVKEAAMCKWWAPIVGFETIHDCILIHGHVGYSEELGLEQKLRDVMGLEFADGTAQIMKLLVARDLMGKDVVSY